MYPLPLKPPSNNPPLSPFYIITECQAELPVLCSSFPLAVCFPRGSVCMGFPGGTSGEEPTCQGRRYNRRVFDPWVRKIPWRRAWQPTPVFLCGKSRGQRSMVSYGP